VEPAQYFERMSSMLVARLFRHADSTSAEKWLSRLRTA
jgi:hypothetical protein